MISFLHTYHPKAILSTIGPISIHWYGLAIVIGIILAILITLYIAKLYNIKRDLVFDLAFYLLIFGIIGARLYDVLLFLPYYINSPISVFKIWEGGMAIHGGIIAGILTIYFFAKKHNLSFWKLSSLITPGIALGQAIGRWGNYFNQELFGLPSSLPWSIPIDIANRPINYIQNIYFHPTFLYESLGNLLIAIILILIIYYIFKKGKLNNKSFIIITALYMVLYSILRFSLEYIRLDKAPYFLGLRWPQVISIIIIIIFIIIPIYNNYEHKKKK